MSDNKKRLLIAAVGFVIGIGFIGYVMVSNAKCEGIYAAKGENSDEFMSKCFIETKIRSDAAALWLKHSYFQIGWTGTGK